MGPIIRIALRYLSGVLIAKGYIGDGDADLFQDPELLQTIEVGAGLAIAAITEWWYDLARAKGWKQ